jgi:phosphonate transport system substrate-binding protein
VHGARGLQQFAVGREVAPQAVRAVTGEIHLALNSSRAWLRAERMARHRNVARQVRDIAMRDTDCDRSSVIVLRSDSGIRKLADLRGKRIGVGAADSPQPTLVPLNFMQGGGAVMGHCRRETED